jgi:FkbH-like protein
MTLEHVKSFNELKKNLRLPDDKLRPVRIALLGDSATQMLTKALKGYGVEAGYRFDIWEADYNQIERQVFDPASELYESGAEFVILFHSAQKLLKKFYKTPLEERANFAPEHLGFVEALYENITARMKCKVIYCNIPELDDSVFGNFANKVEVAFLFQLRKINVGLMDLAMQRKNLFISDLARLQGQYGNAFAFDPKLYVTADMVFSLDFLPVVAKNLTDIIASIAGSFKKCLILDLDNTTWGGIIGDDGLENIQVGSLGIGKAFTELQLWAKELKQRGIILCVCSKNTEHIAKEPFEKHPEMTLRLDDIALFVANWENKADNIRYIQSILEISFDSMVFLDDNPFERNLVRTNLPAVLVPELPEDPAEYVPFLRRLNLFETASHSGNDEVRTKQYQQEQQRRTYATAFSNQDEYLKSLEMKALVQSFDAFSLPRVAQLTQRSNQFNLRTMRYTEEDIQQMMDSGRYLTFSFSLMDKFGDHGLIGVNILEKKNENDLFIDTWIMSCRVLKRGMEEFVLNSLVKAARENNFARLIGEYLPTPKNGLVERHYENLGFEKNEAGFWVLNVSSFVGKTAFISII